MSDEETRGQSQIQFPYVDLQGAIEVARAVLDAGGVPLDRDQLAAALDMAPGSGGFSIKIAAARQFGLLEMQGGKNQLSALGFEVLDPARSRAAMATAFLNVPLYRRVYDEFKGRQLPPRPAGLEQAFVQFGVVPKQKDRARNIFDKSARLAGFFPNANEDRLVMPVNMPGPAPVVDDHHLTPVGVTLPPPAPPPSPPAPTYHPFIEGLLKTLPAPNTNWPETERVKWLATASHIFGLIYKGDPFIAAEPKESE